MVLLENEKLRINNKKEKEKELNPDRKTLQKKFNRANPIFTRRKEHQQTQKEEFKLAYEHLVNKEPNSKLGQSIKEYIISRVEGNFRQVDVGSFEEKKIEKKSKIDKILEESRMKKIKLMMGDPEIDNSDENSISINTPNTQLVKQCSKNGYMRPTNSPVRFKKRSYSGFKKRSSSGALSKSSSSKLKK